MERSFAHPSQNRKPEFSTEAAWNFHFSLALEWVANVEWA
jgi:hypothetical protein